MGEIATVPDMLKAWYRLVGTNASDDALTEQGEAADEVAYTFLTEGIRDAQDWLIMSGGGERWHATANLVTWLGAEASDGGRYIALPSDCLRIDGDDERTALRYPDGTDWGREMDARDRFDRRGNFYYVINDNLWIARGADPPNPVVLHYFKRHTALPLGTGLSLDFPTDAMPLIPAFGAVNAMADAWFPLDQTREAALLANLERWKAKTRYKIRRSRTPRKIRGRKPFGTHYFTGR